MLDKLHRLARVLAPIRWLAALLAAVCAALFALAVLEAAPNIDDGWLLPSLTGLLWGATLATFAATFRDIPGHGTPPASWNLRTRIARAAYWLLGAVLLVALAVVLFLSLRLLMLWRAG